MAEVRQKPDIVILANMNESGIYRMVAIKDAVIDAALVLVHHIESPTSPPLHGFFWSLAAWDKANDAQITNLIGDPNSTPSIRDVRELAVRVDKYLDRR